MQVSQKLCFLQHKDIEVKGKLLLKAMQFLTDMTKAQNLQRNDATTYLQKNAVLAEKTIMDGLHELLIPCLPLLGTALRERLHSLRRRCTRETGRREILTLCKVAE